MNQRSKTFGAAGLLIGILGLGLYAALFASAGLPGTPETLVKARFADVGGLRVGDDVREASVRVGRVQSIEVEGDHALVTLRIADDTQVYRDARAAVWARSGLGQNFVELDRGDSTAGNLGDSVITTDQTVPPSQLDDLLNVLDAKTRKSLGGTLREVGGGMEGRSQQLADALGAAPDLLADLGTVSDTLSASDAELPELLDATRDMSSRFRGHEDEVASLLGNMDDTLSAVAVDQGKPLDQTLREAPAALSETRHALDNLEQPLADLRAAAADLRTGSAALGRSTGDLRVSLRDGAKTLRAVPAVSKQAEPALGDLTEMLVDARPLVDRLAYTFNITDGPAAYMAPYAPELSQFFDYWHSANGSGDVSGHYLRLGVVVRPESVDGVLPFADPLTHRNPYPAPGQAQQDRAPGAIGGN